MFRADPPAVSPREEFDGSHFPEAIGARLT
jgi:hypothetical protein